MKKLLIFSALGLAIVLTGCSLTNSPAKNTEITNNSPVVEQQPIVQTDTVAVTNTITATAAASDCGQVVNFFDNSKFEQNKTALTCLIERYMNNCQSVKLAVVDTEKYYTDQNQAFDKYFLRDFYITDIVAESQNNCLLKLVDSSTKLSYSCKFPINQQMRDSFPKENHGALGNMMLLSILSVAGESINNNSAACSGLFIDKMKQEKKYQADQIKVNQQIDEAKYCGQPKTDESGKSVYTIAEKYAKFPYLGQMFTAMEYCQDAETRIGKMSGVVGGYYNNGVSLTLKSNAPQAFLNYLKNAGYVRDSSNANHWENNNAVIISEAKDAFTRFIDYIVIEDCINCG